MPGSRIPVVDESVFADCTPDDLILLPWNIKNEIINQLSYLSGDSVNIVTVIPTLQVINAEKNDTSEAPGGKAKCEISPSILYAKPSITELEVRYATDAAQNGWGPRCYDYINKFENSFKEHLGLKYAVATSSCTGALHLGLAAAGVGRGDEVILADINWIASAAPITYLNAIPVFVDITPDTWCIDVKRVEEAITEKTKAIIAVHLYGNLCDMESLLSLGARYGIPIIEDAAEAIGSSYNGRPAGSFGAFSVFSFHGTKTVTTGEGGLIATDSEELYEKVLTLSNHGRARNENRQFWPQMIGFKYKMSNVQAAIGCGQLERLDELVGEKQRIYDAYREFLQGSGIQLNPEPNAIASPGYWMVNAVFPQGHMDVERRKKLIEALRVVNADARVFFWPLTMTGHFVQRHATPVSYEIYKRSLNLPSASGLTKKMCSTVSNVVKRFSEPRLK